MSDEEKVALLREALAPFVYAYEDAQANKTPCAVALAFFRHAAEAMRATEPQQ